MFLAQNWPKTSKSSWHWGAPLIKIQPRAIDLSTRLWGINTEFVGFIPKNLELKSIVFGWILIYRKCFFLFWLLLLSIMWGLPMQKVRHDSKRNHDNSHFTQAHTSTKVLRFCVEQISSDFGFNWTWISAMLDCR